jgi:very-short-patch-repair endonuclease
MSGIARVLRRRATEAEKLLWSRLRNRQIGGVKFKRQVPIAGYVADFAALEQNLVIEVDGGQHGPEVDAVRTAALEKCGFHVVRFWNNEVLTNIDGVPEAIFQELDLALGPLTPTLSPQGRGSSKRV